MPNVNTDRPPINALTGKYARSGAFVDCFYIDIPREVTLDHFMQAFYNTALFKLELSLLSVWVKGPSSNNNIVHLAPDQFHSFSIWTLEAKEDNQILLCDHSGRTRSWLMVKPVTSVGPSPMTRLYFGSVVVPQRKKHGRKSFGMLFHLLSGFHRLYSRALLKSAFNKLIRNK